MKAVLSISLFSISCTLILTCLVACSESTPDAETKAKTSSPPSQLQNATVQSTKGAYSVTLQPKVTPVRIGTPQPWIARITDANGVTFVPKSLYFDGGMPGHGHGLPNAPQFTEHLGGSDYLLEGLSLNMPGDWRFVVTVDGPAGVDEAIFNFTIQPITTAQAVASWSTSELALIGSLRLSELGSPVDPSNRFMHIDQAVALGEALFNAPELSATGTVSCATCHNSKLGFADGKKLGFGSTTTKRHTPALTGAAHATWFYWDGRRDSLWAQAVTPLETSGEMDNNRNDVVRFVFSDSRFATALTELSNKPYDFSDPSRFPSGASPLGPDKLSWHRMATSDKELVNEAFALIGKVLASYEATLQHVPGRFDLWADALLENASTVKEPLTETEQAGLRLFLDIPRTQCLRCHNGPQFTNQGFHNVATAQPQPGTAGQRDFGRMLGLKAVLNDPFNCDGSYSDAAPDQCESLRFARRQNLDENLNGAFKVPSLRNLTATAPYFHDGRFDSLKEAVDHYRNQLGGDRNRISEVPDIEISDTERDQLVAFLQTL